MRTIICTLLFFTLSYANLIAQTPEDDDSGSYVETMPEYPGGEKALFKYLSKNTIYPKAAYKNNIGGKVLVEFIVGSDGYVRNVSVIKGIGHGCDEEAMRVVAGMKRWKPGTQNGKKVAVSYRLPINFTPNTKK